MVAAQLRAAIGVGKSPHVVDAAQIALLFYAAHYSVGLPVDAANGRHDPQFVAYAHAAVLAQIAVDFDRVRCRVYTCAYRAIYIFEVIAQPGSKIMRMNPLSGANILRCYADRIAVFDNVLALDNIAEREFVTAHDVGDKRHYAVAKFSRFAAMHPGFIEHHGYIVVLVYLQVTLHL